MIAGYYARVVHSIKFEFKLVAPNGVSSLVFQRPANSLTLVGHLDVPGNDMSAIVLGWGGVGQC